MTGSRGYCMRSVRGGFYFDNRSITPIFSMTAGEGENVSVGSSNVLRPLLFVSCVMNKI